MSEEWINAIETSVSLAEVLVGNAKDVSVLGAAVRIRINEVPTGCFSEDIVTEPRSSFGRRGMERCLKGGRVEQLAEGFECGTRGGYKVLRVRGEAEAELATNPIGRSLNTDEIWN